MQNTCFYLVSVMKGFMMLFLTLDSINNHHIPAIVVAAITTTITDGFLSGQSISAVVDSCCSTTNLYYKQWCCTGLCPISLSIVH